MEISVKKVARYTVETQFQSNCPVTQKNIKADWPDLLDRGERWEKIYKKDIYFANEEQGREYYYLFVREDRIDINATDLSTLENARVGINKGSVQADFFQEWCEKNNVKCQINYACGYAFSGDYPEASLLDLLNEADLKMYEDKVQSKQGRRN